MAREISTRPLAAADVVTWDDEADVVVVGYGIAGVSAALGAAEAGVDVLALERGGGTEGLCGAVLYLGGGTPMQTAMGWEDSAANMQTFLTAALGPGGVDEEKLTAYCQGSVDHYHWLVGAGVPLDPGPDPECSALAAPAEDGFADVGGLEYAGGGLVWSGGEAAYPFDRLVPAVPRGHVPRDLGTPEERSVEEMLEGTVTKALLAHAAGTAVRVRYDTGAERLILDPDGSVVGIEGVCAGSAVRIKARGGVVLATGSFLRNEDMLRAYCPQLPEMEIAAIGHGGQDGLGIRMGQAVGAEAIHMDAIDVTLLATPPLSFRAGILLNRHGQRFINEDTYFGRSGIEALLRHEGIAYLLLDDSIFPERSWRRPSWVSDSLLELEHDIGFPPGALVDTVAYYNNHAADGEDPMFHKNRPWLQRLGGTYAVIDLRAQPGPSPEGVGYIRRESSGPADVTLGWPLTMGGLHTALEGEVAHVSGGPVDGLYAAGRTTSGLGVYGYCSGISLGDCSFFGRRAGRAAAARARHR